MRRIEVELADWHLLFKELQHARLRLKQAEADQPGGTHVRELQSEVRRLQQASDQALEVVHTVLAAGKPARCDPPIWEPFA